MKYNSHIISSQYLSLQIANMKVEKLANIFDIHAAEILRNKEDNASFRANSYKRIARILLEKFDKRENISEKKINGLE